MSFLETPRLPPAGNHSSDFFSFLSPFITHAYLNIISLADFEQSHTLYILLLCGHYVFEIHPCSVWLLFPDFNCCMVFHFMNMLFYCWEYLGCSQLGALIIVLLWKFLCIFRCPCAWILWGIYLGVELLDHMIIKHMISLIFWETSTIFSEVAVPVYIPNGLSHNGSNSSLINTYFPNGCEGISHCHFDLHFPNNW